MMRLKKISKLKTNQSKKEEEEEEEQWAPNMKRE
jgi:hypothetical protein